MVQLALVGVIVALQLVIIAVFGYRRLFPLPGEHTASAPPTNVRASFRGKLHALHQRLVVMENGGT